MALQFWLPLTKDTRNQGLTSCTVSNGGASYSSTGGKLGGCYTFSNTPLYGDWSDINSLTKFSACMWVYLTTTSSALYFIHCGGTGSWTSKVSLDYEGGIRSQINGSEYISGLTLSTNTWYHLAMTWDGSTLSWYINGEFKKSVSTAGSFSASNHFAIGARTAASDGKTFAYPITSAGRLNDVRLYDHCLDDKSIKRISLGLVGSWLCNDLYPSKDIITSLVAGGRTAVSGRTVTTNATDDDTYFRLNLSEALVSGTNYIFSCYVSGMPSGSTWTFGLNNLTVHTFELKPGGNRIYFQANSTSAAYSTSNLLVDDLTYTSGTRTNKVTISNIRLYKCTVLPDALSGLHNDLLVSGTVSLSSDTKRYDRSLVLTGNSMYLLSSNNLPALNDFTISCWFKSTETSSTPERNIVSLYSSGNDGRSSLWITSGQLNKPAFWMGGTTAQSSEALTANTWYHLCATRSGSTITLYVNGVSKATISKSTATPETPVKIGPINPNSSNYGTNYQVSDIRIYATALSSGDIQELYKLGV